MKPPRESSWGTYCGDEAVVKGKSIGSCLGVAELENLGGGTFFFFLGGGRGRRSVKSLSFADFWWLLSKAFMPNIGLVKELYTKTSQWVCLLQHQKHPCLQTDVTTQKSCKTKQTRHKTGFPVFLVSVFRYQNRRRRCPKRPRISSRWIGCRTTTLESARFGRLTVGGFYLVFFFFFPKVFFGIFLGFFGFYLVWVSFLGFW